jgi:hypothetical protein
MRLLTSTFSSISVFSRLPTKFHVDISYNVVLELCPGQSSKYKNEQRDITPKLDKALHIYPIRSIYLQSFMLTSLIHVVLELCHQQSSKYKNEQKVIAPKLVKAELQFLCNAHLPNEINQPIKFHVDTSCCYKVMSRTRKAEVWTDDQTDGQSTEYKLTLRGAKNA